MRPALVCSVTLQVETAVRWLSGLKASTNGALAHESSRGGGVRGDGGVGGGGGAVPWGQMTRV